MKKAAIKKSKIILSKITMPWMSIIRWPRHCDDVIRQIITNSQKPKCNKRL